MLCDAGHQVGGKLYLLGAGFDRLVLMGQPQLVRMALAMQVEVPWSADQQVVDLKVGVRDADGTPLEYNANLRLETRPVPDVPVGVPTMVAMLVPIEVTIPGAGRFVIELNEGDRVIGRTAFQALLPPAATAD